ncbi:hypothetical protein GQ44DRAFT_770463 [Phaeosphaeriaceae sp. PMI808]|nr:hypothetical protein GQ44DRAFT_770463 [Phaeosphaeriaceae sp. PMI808]
MPTKIRPAFRVAPSPDLKPNFKFVDEYDPAKNTLVRKQARAWVNENREADLFKLDIESRDEIPCNQKRTSAIAQSPPSHHNGLTPTTGATALTKEEGSFFYQSIHQTPALAIETCKAAIEGHIHSWVHALCPGLAQTIAKALLACVWQRCTVPDELCKSPLAKILTWVAGIDDPNYQVVPIVVLKWIAGSVFLEHKKIPCGYSQREADNLNALFDALKSYEQLIEVTWLSKPQDDSPQNASTPACHIGEQLEDLVPSKGKFYRDTNCLNGQVGPMPWESSNSITFLQPLYQLSPLGQTIHPPASQEPDHLSYGPLYTSSTSMPNLPSFVALPGMTLEPYMEQPLDQHFAKNGISPEIFKVRENLYKEYRDVASQFDSSLSDIDRLGGFMPPVNPSRQRTNLNETGIGFEEANPPIYRPSPTPISIFQTPNVLAPSLQALPVDVLQFSHKGFELLVPVELSNYSSTLVNALKSIVDDGALEEVKEATNVDVINCHEQTVFALINLPGTRREGLNDIYGYPIVLVEKCSMVVSGLFITSIRCCLGLKQGERFILHEYFKGENFARIFYDELYTNGQLQSRRLRPNIERPTQDGTSQKTSIPLSWEPVHQNAFREVREASQQPGYNNAESQGPKRAKTTNTGTTSQWAKHHCSTNHA